jgi:cell division protein FtsB
MRGKRKVCLLLLFVFLLLGGCSEGSSAAYDTQATIEEMQTVIDDLDTRVSDLETENEDLRNELDETDSRLF